MPDVVALGPEASGDEEDPTYDDLHELVAALGWNMRYNTDTRICSGGDEWCNLQDPNAPVDETEGMYTKAVLKTMNLVNRMNRGVATFMLRLGRAFTVKVRIGRTVVAGKQRTVALRPAR